MIGSYFKFKFPYIYKVLVCMMFVILAGYLIDSLVKQIFILSNYKKHINEYQTIEFFKQKMWKNIKKIVYLLARCIQQQNNWFSSFGGASKTFRQFTNKTETYNTKKHASVRFAVQEMIGFISEEMVKPSQKQKENHIYNIHA